MKRLIAIAVQKKSAYCYDSGLFIMKPIDLLKKKNFLSLFISQATGAFNDNALKMILAGIVLANTHKDEHGWYLSLINALLITPFILFSPAAGWLSDRFSKRTVLFIFKLAELFILLLALWALYLENIWALFLLLFAMGTQAAFYSPAKYGILKEIGDEKGLGMANGMIEMATIAAIILGTVAGAFLYDSFKSETGYTSLVIPFLILSFFSFIGVISTLKIDKLSSNTEEHFSLKTFFKTIAEIKQNKKTRLTIIGISYFWFSGMLLNLLLILFGTQSMGLTKVSQASLLFLYLSIGVSFGSYLAGVASRFSVGIRLIPAGLTGMGITSLILPHLSNHYLLVVADLIVMGIFGGLFLVPLNTMLQLGSADGKRGRIIAISNMFNNLGMLLSSAMLALLSSYLKFSPDIILYILGILSFIISSYISSDLRTHMPN